MTLREFLLFIHVLLAIVGFGPTFAFAFIGRAGGREPEHVNFALRVSEIISERLVIPAAALLPLVGAWLIFEGNWDLWASEWLWISIVLFTGNFFFSVTLQRTTLKQLIEMSKAPPPPREGAPPGPPPEVMRLTRRMQVGGQVMGLILIVIVLLMVWKPGAAVVP